MHPPVPEGPLSDSLLERGFSRRSLGRIFALAAAGATLPFANEASLAQLSNLGRRLPEGAVKINANEFPAALTPEAIAKLVEVAEQGNRYQYEETGELITTISEIEKVSTQAIAPYPGSSLALHHTVIAFTAPGKPLVTVSPGYEAAARAAEFIGADVHKIPLRADGSHDVKKMLEVAKTTGAGLLYVCNPSNPTGSVTTKADIDWLIANKPAGTVVLVDEAYIHFTDQPAAAQHVIDEHDVVVLRTFSKIYGMAGLRAGFAMARPDLLEKITAFRNGALPATAIAAANVMLQDNRVVAQRKARGTAIREDLCAFFDHKGFEYVPSESFKVMVDTRMPVKTVIDGMKSHNVYVGRPWPEWPNHLRVSLGSESDMATFKNAFLQVVSGS